MKRNISMLLCIIMVLCLMPSVALGDGGGAQTELDISKGNIVISATEVSGYDTSNAHIKTPNPNGYIIGGNSTNQYTITVTGGKHDITLQSISIYTTTGDTCAFEIMSGATVNLKLIDGNRLASMNNRAGLQVPTGATLTILGTGSLDANGGNNGAGIGGGNNGSGGNITIISGTVNAQGGSEGAGIGGGRNGSGGNITIFGGTVTAQGGNNGAGIGSGHTNGGNTINGGNIIIKGGTVTATGGSDGAGICNGYMGEGGNVTIQGGTVKAQGGERSAGIGGGFSGAGGTVIITGGSVMAKKGTSGDKDPAHDIGRGEGSSLTGDKDGTLKNGLANGDQDLELVTVTLTDAGVAIGKDIPVTDFATRDYYGMNDVKTMDGGVLYLYLPSGTNGHSIEKALTGGNSPAFYTCDPADADTSVTLSKDITKPVTQSDTPAATVTTVSKATAKQKSVSIALSSTPAVSYKVYNSNDISADVMTNVTTSASGSTLTLTSLGDDLPAGKYYISALESMKSESDRLEITVLAYVPSSTSTNVFSINDGPITIEPNGSDMLKVSYGASETIIPKTDTITITGNSFDVSKTVLVKAGANAKITIKDLSIDVSGKSGACAFEIENNATVDLTLSDTNSLTSGEGKAGLEVYPSATLTISGNTTDSLTAQGGAHAAGIGSGNNNDVGKITIKGGTVTAKGGVVIDPEHLGGAGIGGGGSGKGGDVTISGGIVTAQGGNNSAGIGGCGSGNHGGNVTITGGIVTAKGGTNAAGIGGGSLVSNGGNVTISGGTVKAQGGTDAAGIGGGDHGSGGTVIITGGSVMAKNGGNYAEDIGHGGYSGSDGTLTNAEGAALELVTVTLTNASGNNSIAANIPVTDFNMRPSYYGMKDVVTMEGGAIYLYLPSDHSINKALTGGSDRMLYTCTPSNTTQSVTLTNAGAASKSDALTPANGVATKTNASQSSVSYTLTNATPVTGTFRVYNAGGTELTGITASVTDSVLTLSGSTGGIPEGDYYVSVTASCMLESERTLFTVRNAGGTPTMPPTPTPVSTPNAGGMITYTHDDWVRDNQYDEMAPSSGLEPDVVLTPAPVGTTAPVTAPNATLPPQTGDNVTIIGFVMMIVGMLVVGFRRKRV